MALVNQLLGKKINIGAPATDRRGRLCVPAVIDFTTQAQITIDGNVQSFLRDMGSVQGVYVDNSGGYYDIVIFIPDNQQTVTITGGTQGYYPLMVTDEMRLVISNLNGNVQLFQFYNVPIEAAQWNVGALDVSETQYNVTTTFSYAGYANPTLLHFITATSKRLWIGGNRCNLLMRSTASTIVNATIEKLSAASTGGSPVYQTPSKNDTLISDSTALCGWYTSAPVSGPVIEISRYVQLATNTLTGAPPGAGLTNNISLILQPGESLVSNFGGAALPAGTIMSLLVIWNEF